MKNRIERINQLIRKKIADILLKEIFVKGFLITVQSVDTSKDLKYAKVKVSVMPFSGWERVVKILEKQTSNVQNKLNSVIKIKFVPRIKFVIDKSEERADRIEALLKKIKSN